MPFSSRFQRMLLTICLHLFAGMKDHHTIVRQPYIHIPIAPRRYSIPCKVIPYYTLRSSQLSIVILLRETDGPPRLHMHACACAVTEGSKSTKPTMRKRGDQCHANDVLLEKGERETNRLIDHIVNKIGFFSAFHLKAPLRWWITPLKGANGTQSCFAQKCVHFIFGPHQFHFFAFGPVPF